MNLSNLEAIAKAASPGAWFWRFNKTVRSCYLSTSTGRGGWRTVLDFVRFGMGRAAPRFCVDGIMFRPDELPGAALPDHNGDMRIEHPDAAFIAAANPAAVLALIDAVKASREALDAYEREWPQQGLWRTSSPEAAPIRAAHAAFVRLGDL